GVFQGTVYVERAAQKTNAHQLSRALMLSDRAAMDNKPELEIYADDVKCGHGATIGDIDETALFYLKSRGIDEVTARRLLIEAFLGEVAETIEAEALRERLQKQLFDRLGSLGQ
ncbi:MAG TPA: SufD family Fe-S cluster assembly protein, partial [Magnetospirillaceae bacterium]|nr:SufD family Fe-S cluster assembly protein [Magnetospirillaceae bacterium]